MNLETKIKTLEEAKSKLVEAQNLCFEASRIKNSIDPSNAPTNYFSIRTLIQTEEKLIEHEIKRLRIKGE